MLAYPRLILGVLAVFLLLAGYYGMRFNFDASSDTLVVQGDPDLLAYQQVSNTFGGDEFLLVTFTPHTGKALAPENLVVLRELQEALQTLHGVESVFSILDAPLLRSPQFRWPSWRRGF